MSKPLATESVMQASDVSVLYDGQKAVKSVSLSLEDRAVYALIGPSGCGKSSFLRCFNRMNDSIQSFTLNGTIHYRGQDIYGHNVDPVLVRKHVGMVFQKPMPFPGSIYHNIAWAPKLNGYEGNLDELVASCLRKAALWDEVKDRLDASGLSLSGGQQQRLCIARTIAMQPDVILMDEPCASLDPISTEKIEDLIAELKEQYCILIVTHSMQQARRVSDYTAFMYQGELVEFGPTAAMFENPQETLTQDYVSGRFG